MGDPFLIGLLAMIAIGVFILLGAPIAAALGIIGIIGIVLVEGWTYALGVAALLPFSTVASWTLIAVPLFTLMGYLAFEGGLSEDLYQGANALFGQIPGGLAMSSIAACAGFAAVSGSSVATATAMGKISIPQMRKYGYAPTLAAGAVVTGGTLGILIPPSIMLIVYGPMAGLSVGKLFMGAILPGLALSLLYAIYIIARCFLNPELGPALPLEQRAMPLGNKLTMVATSMLPTLLLILAVLGTIFFGIAAPTEASAVGAFASLLLAYAYKKLSWENFKSSIYQTLKVSSMIMLIVAAAFVFTGAFMLIGGGDIVKDALLNLPVGRWGVLMIMMATFFFFGLFMEWVGIVPILVPIFTPVLAELGFDPLWAAMLFCVTMQTSFLTPPMAPALFYLKGVAPKDIEFGRHIVGGTIPFIIIQVIGVGLIALFPQIVLWLPTMMIK